MLRQSLSRNAKGKRGYQANHVQETTRTRASSKGRAQIVNLIDTDDEEQKQIALEKSVFNSATMAANGTRPEEVFEEFIATDERKAATREATKHNGDQEVDSMRMNCESNGNACIVIASKEKCVRIHDREGTQNLQQTDNIDNEVDTSTNTVYDNGSNAQPDKADTNSNAEANLEATTSVEAANYKCWNCPEKFVHAIDLKNHVIKMHNKTKKGGKHVVECEKCFKGFTSNGELSSHMRKKHFSFGSKDKVKCQKCSKDFVDEETLLRHMQRVHPVEEEKTFVCEKCGERFVREWLLNEHKGFKHPKEGQTNIKCDKCPESFKSLRNLLKHLDRFHNPNRVKNMKEKPTKPVNVPDGKRFQCTKCIKTTTFANELIFQAHEGYHTTGYYKCPKCNEKCAKKISYLRDHLIRAHPSENIEYWACKKCSMKFGAPNRLYAHMGDVHKIYKCKKCSEQYRSILLLKFHENDAHLMEEQKTLTCKECPKKFALPIVLWYHTKKYHSPKNKKTVAGANSDTNADDFSDDSCDYEPYQMSDSEYGDLVCKICKKVFENRVMLQAHLNFHVIRYHPCYLCFQKFIHKADLRNHLHKNHSAENVVFLSCPKCSIKFDKSSLLKRHLLRTHKLHLCYVQNCTESFRSLLLLKLHQNNVHIEEEKKTNICEKCSEKFSTDEVLQYHLKKAHNIGGSQASASGSQDDSSDTAPTGNARKRVKLSEIEATTSTSEEYSSAVTDSEDDVSGNTSST